jgi:hypothetical protein
VGLIYPHPLFTLTNAGGMGLKYLRYKKTTHILEKIAQDRARAVPMPADIKAKLDALRGR